jgi:hypothetical protein
MAPKKIGFVQAVQAVSTGLAQSVDKCADLYSIYFDRGYNGSGVDPITDADIEGQNITAAQVTAFIVFAEALGLFTQGQSHTAGDYDATLNALRTDQ